MDASLSCAFHGSSSLFVIMIINGGFQLQEDLPGVPVPSGLPPSHTFYCAAQTLSKYTQVRQCSIGLITSPPANGDMILTASAQSGAEFVVTNPDSADRMAGDRMQASPDSNPNPDRNAWLET